MALAFPSSTGSSWLYHSKADGTMARACARDGDYMRDRKPEGQLMSSVIELKHSVRSA